MKKLLFQFQWFTFIDGYAFDEFDLCNISYKGIEEIDLVQISIVVLGIGFVFQTINPDYADKIESIEEWVERERED